MNEFNRQVIEEFRSNGGKVGGPFEGATMVLVHHIGARSGTERITPLVTRVDGGDRYIFASKAGAPDHPAWYHNLMATPRISVELADGAGGIESVDVEVVELTGEDRNRVWEAQKADVPQFAEYEAGTDRTIPVLALRPR